MAERIVGAMHHPINPLNPSIKPAARRKTIDDLTPTGRAELDAAIKEAFDRAATPAEGWAASVKVCADRGMQ